MPLSVVGSTPIEYNTLSDPQNVSLSLAVLCIRFTYVCKVPAKYDYIPSAFYFLAGWLSILEVIKNKFNTFFPDCVMKCFNNLRAKDQTHCFMFLSLTLTERNSLSETGCKRNVVSNSTDEV